MDILFYGLTIAFCLVASAFFSSSETALLRISSDDLDDDGVEGKTLSVIAAKELIKSSSSLLVTILVGNNVVNILGATCASSLAVYFLGPQLGLLTSTLLMTILVLLVAEIVPKAIAAKNPKQVSLLVAMPLYFIHKVSFPIHFIFSRYIDPIVNKIVGNNSSSELNLTNSLIRQAARIKVGSFDGSPISIISNTARAKDLCVRDIMVPRAKIFALSIDCTPKELLAEVLKSRFSRVPIYRETIDQIEGVLHIRDIFRLVHNNTDEPVTDYLKPVLRIPDKTPILSLLRQMQQSQIHLAIIKDELGVTDGLITQEDILEEFVGEIRDEFDNIELRRLKKIDASVYEAQGDMLVHDFNREVGWNIPFESGDTLGEILFNLVGRQIAVGDKAEVADGIFFEVLSVKNNKKKVIKVYREQ